MKYFFLFISLCCLVSLCAQDLAKAENLFRHEQWPEAISEYQIITKANPYQGNYWHRLGYALLKNDQLSEAIVAFEKARPLLAFSRNATYNIACCYALLGQKDKAISWLQLAFDEGYNNIHSIRSDDDFKAIRDSKEFKAIFETPTPAGLNRNQQWCFDIEYLTQLFEKKHYFLFHDLSKEEWQQKIHEIEANVPNLTDDQIVSELMKLIASVKDGHSNIFPANGELYFPHMNGHGNANGSAKPNWQPNVLPLQFELFEDGVFIVATDSDHKKWLGAKVIKVGQVEIDEVMNGTLIYIGQDNAMQGKMMGVKLLRMKEFYEWRGIITKGEDPTFTFAHADGSKDVDSIKSHLMKKDKDISWSMMNDAAEEPLPLYLQQPEKFYWSHYLKDDKMVWLQYNAVQNQRHGQSLESFSKELFHFIDNHEVEALVIDVRNNLGGNSFFNQSIVHRVIQSHKINQRGKLFVVTGRKTFSAAMNFATDMEKLTNALFVGERTGSSPNFYGEHNPFHLPFSKIQGSFSSHYYQGGFSSQDHRQWIAPDIIAPLSSAYFRKNKDPALDAILEYLRKK